MREVLRFNGKIKSATVSRMADRWFVSLTVEVDHTPPVHETQVAGGVDLGVKALATLSDGSAIEGPKALRKNLKTLRRRSRALSRKVKGSANRRKAARKLARLHARISNVRKDALHKATTEIVSRFDVIGIEDLNVRGMMANGNLARAVADVGMFEFRRQLEYKAEIAGVRIVVASPWYPSSKTCSDCGHVHAGLTLSDREWTCDDCGAIHDRDHNAAINLMNITAGSSSVAACGAGRAGRDRKAPVKRTAVKQEPTHGIFVHV
jgi:putative transposase